MKLTPQILLYAYSRGVFPMAHGGDIYWYDPDPRAILPLDQFHVSRSLQRTLKRVRVQKPDGTTPYFVDAKIRKSRKAEFLITVNQDFRQVITTCATLERKGSWIDAQIIRAYMQLHQLGFAHSVETWIAGELVGGLYGVTLNGLFAGESMFSTATDASKVALAYLVDRLKRRNFQLLDVQFYTPHLGRFGVVEIPREEYKARLRRALTSRARFA